MTARKPVSALALGLSSAVVFGFGAGQAGADVEPVVQQRLAPIQSDQTPSPVLSLSAILYKADVAALLKQLEFAPQVKLAVILRKLPDLSKLSQSKLAELAQADQAKAQIAIAALLAKLPNLSRAQATASAALLVAIMHKSPDLAKLGLSSLPDLAGLDEARAHAAIDALVAKLPQSSNLSKEQVAQILVAIQKLDLSQDADLSDLDLSKLNGLAGLDMAKADALADAIVAKQADLSKAQVAQVLLALGKIDLTQVSGVAEVKLSLAGLSELSQDQTEAIAEAIAAQQQQQSSLSEADVAAAKDALSKIDPTSLPDLSKVDLSKLGAPPK